MTIRSWVEDWVGVADGKSVELELQDGQRVVLCSSREGMAQARAAGKVTLSPLEITALLEAGAAMRAGPEELQEIARFKRVFPDAAVRDVLPPSEVTDDAA